MKSTERTGTPGYHAESGNEELTGKLISSILVKTVGLNCVIAPCLLMVILAMTCYSWEYVLLGHKRRPQRGERKVVKITQNHELKTHAL